MDKRVEHTRNELYRAMGELLQEKSLSDIKMQEIAKRAHLNRVTIYAHYHDKIDLYNQYSAEMVAKLFQDSIGTDPYEDFLKTFAYIKNHQRIYHSLISGENSSVFYAELLRWLFEYIDRTWTFEKEPTRQKALLRKWFLASGVTGILIKWIEDSNQYEPEQIARDYLDMMKREVE